MKVAHLATSATGGAGSAAFRMDRALKSIGVDSNFYVPLRRSKSEEICDLRITKLDAKKSSAVTFLQRELLQKTSELITTFSYNSVDLEDLDGINCDVLHLHAFYNLLSPQKILELANFTNKKMFVTLHDERFFTGGCHYSDKCDGFVNSCTKCPQVRTPFKRLPQFGLRKSLETIDAISNITFISPSHWLREKALSSALLSEADIHVVRNPIPMAFFVEKKAPSRELIGIESSKQVFGFISANLNNPYKNISFFIEAMNLFFENLTADRKRNFLVFFIGNGSIMTKDIRFPYFLRNFESDDLLSEGIAALDYLVVPSISDNCPSVLGEALASGVGILGSDVGGIPEILHEFNYLTYRHNCLEDFMDKLNILCESKSVIKQKELAERVFGNKSIAEKIEKIYQAKLAL